MNMKSEWKSFSSTGAELDSDDETPRQDKRVEPDPGDDQAKGSLVQARTPPTSTQAGDSRDLPWRPAPTSVPQPQFQSSATASSAEATADVNTLDVAFEAKVELYLEHMEDAEFPQWNGEQESWEAYRNEVETYLKHVEEIREKPAPLQAMTAAGFELVSLEWNDDEEALTEKQDKARISWLRWRREQDREKRARTTGTSASSSGTAMPAPGKPRTDQGPG